VAFQFITGLADSLPTTSIPAWCTLFRRSTAWLRMRIADRPNARPREFADAAEEEQ
jgi:hypothetical protein